MCICVDTFLLIFRRATSFETEFITRGGGYLQDVLCNTGGGGQNRNVTFRYIGKEGAKMAKFSVT